MLLQNYRKPSLKFRTFSFHLHAESMLSTNERFVHSWLFPVDTLSICFPSGWLHAAKGLHWSPHSEIFLASRKLTKHYIGLKIRLVDRSDPVSLQSERCHRLLKNLALSLLPSAVPGVQSLITCFSWGQNVLLWWTEDQPQLQSL